jgi:hypothetical protein
MVTYRSRPQERKRERRKMKRRTAQGLAAAHRIPPAADEEFTAMANALDGVARVHLSWDPYEVWRTRVKESFSVMPERERDPVHLAGDDRAAGVALAGINFS